MYHHENHGVHFGTGTSTVETTEHLSEPELAPWKPLSTFRNRNHYRGNHGAFLAPDVSFFFFNTE
ncbi:MAG: hypothetical protein AB7G44_09215 [Bacteroidia bacterium]